MGGRSVCVEQRCVKGSRLLTLPVRFWRVSDSALSSHHEGEPGRPPPAGMKGGRMAAWYQDPT